MRRRTRRILMPTSPTRPTSITKEPRTHRDPATTGACSKCAFVSERGIAANIRSHLGTRCSVSVYYSCTHSGQHGEGSTSASTGSARFCRISWRALQNRLCALLRVWHRCDILLRCCYLIIPRKVGEFGNRFVGVLVFSLLCVRSSCGSSFNIMLYLPIQCTCAYVAGCRSQPLACP